jgi:hypothetical protein
MSRSFFIRLIMFASLFSAKCAVNRRPRATERETFCSPGDPVMILPGRVRHLIEKWPPLAESLDTITLQPVQLDVTTSPNFLRNAATVRRKYASSLLGSTQRGAGSLRTDPGLTDATMTLNTSQSKGRGTGPTTSLSQTYLQTQLIFRSGAKIYTSRHVQHSPDKG